MIRIGPRPRSVGELPTTNSLRQLGGTLPAKRNCPESLCSDAVTWCASDHTLSEPKRDELALTRYPESTAACSGTGNKGGDVAGIRLTPTGHLCWEASEDPTKPAQRSALRKVFSVDWREGLFTLAAEKSPVGDSLTLRFWQRVADRYLTALCHIPGSAKKIEVVPPSPAECATLVLTAPPMRGGEYLAARVLRDVWIALDGWASEAIISETTRPAPKPLTIRRKGASVTPDMGARTTGASRRRGPMDMLII